MIKQIPRSRLPHTVDYQYDLDNNGESITYTGSETLRYVKLEEKTVLKMDKDGKEVVGKAVLFYDYQNSYPQHLSFSEQDLITFNNKEYEIRDIEIYYGDKNTPHHYELILV